MADDLSKTTAIERVKFKQQGIVPGDSKRGLNRAEDNTGTGVKVRDYEDPLEPDYTGPERRKKGRRKSDGVKEEE